MDLQILKHSLLVIMQRCLRSHSASSKRRTCDAMRSHSSHRSQRNNKNNKSYCPYLFTHRKLSERFFHTTSGRVACAFWRGLLTNCALSAQVRWLREMPTKQQKTLENTEALRPQRGTCYWGLKCLKRNPCPHIFGASFLTLMQINQAIVGH